MNKNCTFKLSIAAIAASLLVTACGGGGGSDSSAATGKPASGAGTTAPASGAGTGSPGNSGSTAPSTGTSPATSIPASTYDGASFEAAAFKQLNDYRVAMGVGALKQDPVLDTSAQAHARYMYTALKAQTTTTLSHDEVAGNKNYYGDTPLARARKAGAPSNEWISEIIGAGASQTTAADAAADCIGQALDTVYHLVDVTFNQEAIGFGYQPGEQSWPQYTCAADFGTYTGVSGSPGSNTDTYAGGQQIATNTVVHAPLNNENGVRLAMVPEAPNPATDLSAPGHPIAVRVNSENFDTLSVSQFTLMESNGTQVAVRIMVPASAHASSTATTTADPNNLLPNGSAVLLPLAPLKANTTYTVTFNGARDGVTLPTATWSFTTGAK
ncbi:CAP domain-containing protein [Caballeronia sp. LZ043]|uniref:CAP domain-containing protein n=1 Tax=Caballeronia sp. LZ043 TaxID=3038569 RepID=UPI00285B9083|nr:CAP domain-containing protein [Caballeronia sp. LZ043]MDR5826012.1 CAP domain-containing protein [Caballeronia sp. LZ043]